MKKTIIVAISLLFLLSFQVETKPKWEKIKSKNGISVYRMEVPGKDHVIFKGKGVVNKEMFLVLSVLGDINNLTKWIDRLKSAKLVKEVSDMELILYNVVTAPWPLQNRDMVLRTKATYDKKYDWVHIRGRNIKHPKYPKKSGIVRIPYMRNTWSLKPIRKGKATWVEFKVQADPGGAIPAWVSNMVSKDVPYKSLMNLRKRVRQGKYSRYVLKKIQRYAKANGLIERYKKKFGPDYIKTDEYYEKTYSLVK